MTTGFVTKRRGRPPNGERAMTAAERQQRRRAKLRDAQVVTKPAKPDLVELVRAINAEWTFDDLAGYAPPDGWRLAKHLPGAIEKLVALGRAEEGLGYAEQALLSLKTVGGFTMDVSVPQLAQLEALLALGRTAEAREAAAAGRRRLLRRAERLSDPVWQARLLAHPENAQFLAYDAAEPGRAE